MIHHYFQIKNIIIQNYRTLEELIVKINYLKDIRPLLIIYPKNETT